MTIRTGISASIFTLLLAVGTVLPAAGQQTATPEGAAEETVWTEDFGEQVRVLLETGDPERQKVAVRFVLQYSGENGPDIDFRPVVPELFRLYEKAEDESLRIMAVNALSAVGGESAMTRLADQVHYEESDRVRQQMVRALAVRLQGRSEGR